MSGLINVSSAEARAFRVEAKCAFAQAGTYGHECGAPASLVAVFVSRLTRSGLFYARRCVACAALKGGENVGAIRFEPLDPEAHRNVWK